MRNSPCGGDGHRVVCGNRRRLPAVQRGADVPGARGRAGVALRRYVRAHWRRHRALLADAPPRGPSGNRQGRQVHRELPRVRGGSEGDEGEAGDPRPGDPRALAAHGQGHRAVGADDRPERQDRPILPARPRFRRIHRLRLRGTCARTPVVHIDGRRRARILPRLRVLLRNAREAVQRPPRHELRFRRAARRRREVEARRAGLRHVLPPPEGDD